MRFRLRAFGVHLLGSTFVLGVVLAALYVGWYRWPGWYLAAAPRVAALMAGVNLALGPLLTLLIASAAKPRRALARDMPVIVAVQLAALLYGTITLWSGRPLYYTFSEDRLEMVQASDLEPQEIARARQDNPGFAPHLYSLPRWVWAPLPQDPRTRNDIMQSAIAGGKDVIQMPRYFRAWQAGFANLRAQLQPLEQFGVFTGNEKRTLKERMARLGFAPDEPMTLFLMGRVRPLLVVFDRHTLRVKAIIRCD